MVTRSPYRVVLPAACSVLLACGGRASLSLEGEPAGAERQLSEHPKPGDGDGDGDGDSFDVVANPEEPQCGAKGEDRLIEPAWIEPLDFYGLGAGSLRYDTAQATLVVTADEYQPERHIVDPRDGTILESTILDRAFLADNSKYAVFRSSEGIEIRDAATGEILSTIEATRLVQVHLSEDGSGVGYIDCQQGHMVVGFHSLTHGTSSIALDYPCAWEDSALVVDSARSRVLFSTRENGALHAYNYENGALEIYEAHMLYEPKFGERPSFNGSLLNIALAPNSEKLATTGTDGRLHVWDAADLTVERFVSAWWFNAFDFCYCTPLSASPVAFSNDATWYAALGADGNIEVRLLCDHHIRARLHVDDEWESVSYSSQFSALKMLFSPSGDALYALYEGRVAGFSLE